MNIVARGTYMVTPLGEGSDSNYEALCQGRSELKPRPGAFGLPETFVGSLLPRDCWNEKLKDMPGRDVLTLFEALCIYCIKEAAGNADLSDPGTIFILSSTKGNVDLLETNPDDPRAYLDWSARKIAGHFGNGNTPVTVSNACVSGVCAQLMAARMIRSGQYRRAVVVGGDLLSRFIVSGFQSFKALSPEICKPFDANRTGLNLGEAFGAIILEATGHVGESDWVYVASSNHNDANHISGPSRTGEGSYRVLRDLLKHVDATELAFVNLHGTATNYNDEMESIAVDRAGLAQVPVNGLKGYFGHTLGAAGVIETIMSMQAVDHGTILPTRGFATQGTSRKLNVTDAPHATDKKAFIKLLSGFGGSNAGICYRKGGAE